MNIVFKMTNTMNMKQKHIVQELKLTDCRKLEIEIHGIKPKIQARWNKVPKRRDFKRPKGLSISSNVRVLCSCQTNHVKYFTPKSTSKLAKKMVHKFPITTTQATPINQGLTSLNKIINGEYPTPSCYPYKERHSFKRLYTPNALPKKKSVRGPDNKYIYITFGEL